MDVDEFWTLIERSRDAGGDREAALRNVLRGRSSEELQAFHRLFDAQLERAYRWDIWGAGYVLNGGMGDDSFDYFLYWLVGQGRAAFEQVLADPDSLADLPAARPDAMEAEGLWGAAIDVHEETFATELPLGESAGRDEPAGEEWDEDEVERLFPRCAAKGGW